MNWNAYPILRLFMPFAVGIIVSDFFPDIKLSLWVLFPFLLINFVFAYVRALFPAYRYRLLSSLPIFFTFFFLGYFYTNYFYPYHSSNYIGKGIDTYTNFLVRLDEEPHRGTKSIKLEAEVIEGVDSVESKRLRGRVMLYLPIDSDALRLQYGDILFVLNRLEVVEGPKNLYEFDYRKYLERKGIRYRAYLPEGTWMRYRERKGFSVKAIALQARNSLLRQLKANGITGDNYSVAASLLLGYKEDMSESLLSAYRQSGVMHILCVSGLHVGIIFMILSYLLAFMKGSKSGARWRVLIILIHIWAFAFITGLSPSVTRSSVMFTMILWAQYLNRDNRLYNTLAVAAMVSLLINPFYLFHVGFLLSYLAVLGIDIFYQPIFDLLSFRWRLLEYFWKLSSVSLAAQIGTAPIVIYYFHQFPNYFLLSNLVVMPLVFVAFYSALASLIFSFIPVVAGGLGWIASQMIYLMNLSVSFIRALPYAVSEHLPMAFSVMILLYLFSLLMADFVKNFNAKALIWSLLTLVFVLAFSLVNTIERRGEAKLVAFRVKKHTAVLYHRGEHSVLLMDSVAYKNPALLDYNISGYINHYGLLPLIYNLDTPYIKDEWVMIKQGLAYVGDRIFCFDSRVLADSITYPQVDYIFYRCKEQRHLDLEGKINIGKVFLSNELYATQRRRFARELQALQRDFYDLNSSPAYVEDL